MPPAAEAQNVGRTPLLVSMPDLHARNELYLALRRLVVGRITNDEFEARLSNRVLRSADPGVQAILWAAWLLYDDLREHRMTGPYALTPSGRRHVARWLVFLKSDVEYEWVEVPFWLKVLLFVPNVATLGLIGSALQWWLDRQGDTDVWPFIRPSDLSRVVSAWPVRSETPQPVKESEA